MKFKLSKILVTFAGCLLPVALLAGGDEVVVVYNTKMAESKALAIYYARKRDVPERQIIGLPLSQFESITRKEYLETLQKPLVKKFETEKFWRLGTRLETGTNGASTTARATALNGPRKRCRANPRGTPNTITRSVATVAVRSDRPIAVSDASEVTSSQNCGHVTRAASANSGTVTSSAPARARGMSHAGWLGVADRVRAD